MSFQVVEEVRSQSALVGAKLIVSPLNITSPTTDPSQMFLLAKPHPQLRVMLRFTFSPAVMLKGLRIFNFNSSVTPEDVCAGVSVFCASARDYP